MPDDSKPTDGERQLGRALQQMREENKRQAAELAASRKALVNMKADAALAASMDASDSRPAARAFATKLIRQEIRNPRLDDDGAFVCDFGEHEGIGADAAVAAFIQANEFLQPVGSGDDALDTSAIVPKALDTAPLHTDSSGNAIPLGELSVDELLEAAGTPPAEMFTGKGEPPDWFRYTTAKPKAAPAKATPLTASDRENMTLDELFAAAGPAPSSREAAEENDAIRRAVINRFHFGSATAAPSGWTLAGNSNLGILSGEVRDRLMDRVHNCDTFDDDDHAASTFDFEGRLASFQLRGDAKTLLIAVE